MPNIQPEVLDNIDTIGQLRPIPAKVESGREVTIACRTLENSKRQEIPIVLASL